MSDSRAKPDMIRMEKFDDDDKKVVSVMVPITMQEDFEALGWVRT